MLAQSDWELLAAGSLGVNGTKSKTNIDILEWNFFHQSSI